MTELNFARSTPSHFFLPWIENYYSLFSSSCIYEHKVRRRGVKKKKKKTFRGLGQIHEGWNKHCPIVQSIQESEDIREAIQAISHADITTASRGGLSRAPQLLQAKGNLSRMHYNRQSASRCPSSFRANPVLGRIASAKLMEVSHIARKSSAVPARNTCHLFFSFFFRYTCHFAKPPLTLTRQ